MCDALWHELRSTRPNNDQSTTGRRNHRDNSKLLPSVNWDVVSKLSKQVLRSSITPPEFHFRKIQPIEHLINILFGVTIPPAIIILALDAIVPHRLIQFPPQLALNCTFVASSDTRKHLNCFRWKQSESKQFEKSIFRVKIKLSCWLSCRNAPPQNLMKWTDDALYKGAAAQIRINICRCWDKLT